MKPEYLDLQSADGSQINIDALYNTLYQIAPSCFTEAKGADGKIRKAINFDVLRQLLGDAAADTGDEFYQFTWPGKAEARREAARPIKKTLRPVKEDSVNWDTTKNLYIEGDNLEVLKLLQKSYLGKVKMIYIDPPYNTGNDFVYNDDFTQSAENYAEASGDVDELGNRFRRNTDANGRFHSDWCSMIYPRLLIARTLLAENGLIFISIDDNEINNLKKICDEIFGASNFKSQSIIVNNRGGRDYGGIALQHDYILIYTKGIEGELNAIEEKDKSFQYYDSIGGFNLMELRNRNVKFNIGNRPNLCYPFYVNPSSPDSNGLLPISLEPQEGYIEVYPAKSNGIQTVWRWGREKAAKGLNTEIFGKPNQNGGYMIVQKYRKTTKMQRSVWDEKEFVNERGTEAVKELFDGKAMFDYPKSVYTLKRVIELGSSEDDIILDFFSGSSSTAQAIFERNAEDGFNRPFIMVQLPEPIQEDTPAHNAGYSTICKVAEERIRRAGKKVKEEAGLNGQDLDIGFRVFRVDDSNMEDVYFQPKAYSQDRLDMFLDNVKADRTDLDLLFGAMLDWGVQLSLPMSTDTVDGRKVYVVNEGDLVACFAENITESVIEHIADYSPLRVLLRDSCFSSDADKINIFEQFKQRLGWSDEEAYKNIRVI